MSFQAYLDAVKAKTGLEPADFARLGQAKGLTKPGEYVAWLKAEHGLGHGHAMAIAGVVLKGDKLKAPPADKLNALFAGPKAAWKETADRLIDLAKGFGEDVAAAPNLTYVNLNRGKTKFAILQPSSGKRLEVGLKLKNTAVGGRLESAEGWNAMLTHRVVLTAPADADAELAAWLKAAYEAAAKSRG